MQIRRFLKGDSRTIKARKNIFFSIAIKGVDSLVYLLLVPVTLGYLNSYEYGIWLTLNSILMWINSFDIGLGNGLRNKLAIAMANNDKKLAQIYVSTTFFMLIAIMGMLMLIGSICSPFIDWYNILNTTAENVAHISEIVFVSFAIFCFNFIFKFVGNVYLALQLPAINNLMVTLGHLLSLIIIFILTKTTQGSLFWVAVVYSTSPLIVYLISYPITFYKIYPFLAPSYRLFKTQYLKDLFNIGVQFFLLQLAGLILFALSNLLISHMFGPESVTPYNIAYRYFSIILMLMNIVISPMWSATTDAYERGDIDWIKRNMKSIHKVLYIAFLSLIFMVVISKWVYLLWVGKSVHIPILLSTLMAIYVMVLIFSLSYSNFINGLGKLTLQTINTVSVAILFIPICYVLGNLYGLYGIIIGMIFLNLSGAVLNYIQFNKLINKKADGIWNK